MIGMELLLHSKFHYICTQLLTNFWKIATALEEKFGVFHLFHFISSQDYDIVWLQKLSKTY